MTMQQLRDNTTLVDQIAKLVGSVGTLQAHGFSDATQPLLAKIKDLTAKLETA